MLGYLLIKLMIAFYILLPQKFGAIATTTTTPLTPLTVLKNSGEVGTKTQSKTTENSTEPGFAFKNNSQLHIVPSYAKVGDSIKLDCEFYVKNGVSWPSITWQKNDKPLHEVSYRAQSFGSIQTINDSLSMDNLLLADNGSYTCRVGNTSKMIQRTFYLYVKEKDYNQKPQIRLLKPGNLTAQVGRQVTFECEAFGSSLPYIQWIKHFKYVYINESKGESLNNHTMVPRPGLRIVNSMKSMNEITNIFKGQNLTMKRKENILDIIEIKSIERSYKNRLIIDNVDLDDDAEYTCIAFNDVGYSIEVGYLHIIPAPIPSKLDLALRYEEKYGNDGGSLIVLPLTVIVAVPISFLVLLIIAFSWWHERNKRNKSADKVSLIPFTTMRHQELFDSEEDLPTHYPKVNRKRLSQIRCDHSIVNTDADDEIQQRSSHFSIPTSKHSISDVIPLHDSLDNHNGRPEADQHDSHDSESELEWEPQELELKVRSGKKGIRSSRSNQSL